MRAAPFARRFRLLGFAASWASCVLAASTLAREAAQAQAPARACAEYLASEPSAPFAAAVPDDVADAQAAREALAVVQRTAPADRGSLRFARLPSVVPTLLKILDGVSPDSYSLPYAIFSDEGEARADVRTVGQAVAALKLEAARQAEAGGATLGWLPRFALEVLTVEEISLRPWHEPVPRALAGLPQDLEALVSRAIDHEGDAGAGDLYAFVFARALATKKTLSAWLEKGWLPWPTLAHWRVERFDDWHLGVRTLAISPELWVTFDGNRRRRFWFFTHDAVAHPMPEEFWPFRHDFTDLQARAFRTFSSLPPGEAELTRYVWFSVTHEAGMLYAAYARHRPALASSNPAERAEAARRIVNGVKAQLAGFAAARPDGVLGLFFERLTSPSYFGSSISPRLRALSSDDLRDLARKTLEAFDGVALRELERHGDWLASRR